MDWDATLDAFEQRLAAQSAALDSGAFHELTPFEAPAIAAPVPPELSERAIELVWRCRALEDMLAAALAKVAKALEDAAEPVTPPAQPVFFDSRI